MKYNGKNLNNVPVFKHWLDLMKTEKNYEGIICYCVNCCLFFYFRNKAEKRRFRHNNHCLNFEYAEQCEYCGELFLYSSICCYKRALESFKKELYDIIKFECIDYILYVPFFSLIYYFARFYYILTGLRYKGQDINNISLAYAISIHKSQGSEFPVVILPIFPSYRVMLNKKLLYTAVTRAKDYLVLIGDFITLNRTIRVLSEDRKTRTKEFINN